MSSPRPTRRAGAAGFTIVEVMISMAVFSMVMGMAISTFLFCLHTMYKDNMRLDTNANLRYFMAQVAKETLDATNFYIFSDYSKLDGNVDLSTATSKGLASATPDPYGIPVYHGDCLVLVTMTSLADNATVQQFRIYYRQTTNPDNEGQIRYYESPVFDASAGTDPAPLIDKVVLAGTDASNPYPGTKLISARALGRLKTPYPPPWKVGDPPPKRPMPPATPYPAYPIFSSLYPTVSPTNLDVSINVEIVNGVSANNLLSSSSFNYTISPRR